MPADMNALERAVRGWRRIAQSRGMDVTVLTEVNGRLIADRDLAQSDRRRAVADRDSLRRQSDRLRKTIDRLSSMVAMHSKRARDAEQVIAAVKSALAELEIEADRRCECWVDIEDVTAAIGGAIAPW